jgi:type IV secretory pathway TraG/TraD family ATPase VirD4
MKVSVVEGMAIQPALPVIGEQVENRVVTSLPGHVAQLRFSHKILEKHVLLLGAIGTGKTNVMMHLLSGLRKKAGADDVFVIFDTKGDFLREFGRDTDAIISSHPDEDQRGVIWNLFRDLLDQEPSARREEIYEIASALFGEELKQAGENVFFATGARDIFAAIVEVMCGEDKPHSNAELRARLELPIGELQELLEGEGGLGGNARYLQGETTPEAVLSFLQQMLNKSFSGVFGRHGDFSVRDFIRRRERGRALFIEYDIAMGSRLLPVYRVLMDMAIKEALSLGRRGSAGNVYFVLDEFALLPQLEHISNGINFGRDLGLKFMAGTQNVNQILGAYGHEKGGSILSGFGTVLALRLMDNSSRDLVRQRFGANRKQITTYAPVRSEGVQQILVMGNVIEDWDFSDLQRGQCIVALPEGPPYLFAAKEYGAPPT